ncbi:MAG: methylmalonyl-CoA mutase [Chlorobiaceae bacterium]|nr:methylmalonyl-CoA mutase [Chlorobiaceae bacterium]
MSQPEPLFSGFPAITHAAWKSRVLEELKGADYAKIVWKTPEGFTMEPWYNRSSSVPFPAVPPGRKTNRWSVCQQIEAGSAAEGAEESRAAIAGGADAVEFRLADPSLVSAANLAVLMGQLDLSKVQVFFSGAIGDASALLGNLMTIPGFSSASGAILNDSSKASLVAIERRPAGFRTLSVNTERFHDAGASIVQELAFSLAEVSDLLNRATDSGIDATKAAASIEVVFCTGTSHFTELAKLRAFRAMWPQVLAAYGVAPDHAPEPRLFVRSSRRTASVLDPYTNILRLSTQAVSAILGGCDTLQLSSFDPASSVSHELADRITRNIHHLLREESGLDRVIDPAAGSFYVDTMTGSLCCEAWKIFQGIEASGGLKSAEADGRIAAMVAPAAEARQKDIRGRKRSLIGINRYTVAPSADVAAAVMAAPQAAADAAPEFEHLRLRMLAHVSKTASTPRVAVWMHGDPVKSLRVSAFAEDFLRTGGFEIMPPLTLPLENKSCRTITQDEPEIVVLCWTGDEDLGSLPSILETMQELHKETIVVMAAKPPENADTYLKTGLDRFIHLGSDAYACLLSLQHKTGVL